MYTQKVVIEHTFETTHFIYSVNKYIHDTIIPDLNDHLKINVLSVYYFKNVFELFTQIIVTCK